MADCLKTLISCYSVSTVVMMILFTVLDILKGFETSCQRTAVEN